MSITMHIKSSERGIIRLFHIDLPREAIERFTTEAGTGEWPLQYALGATSLRGSFVEVIDIRDLGNMPLSEYLSNAHDLTGEDFSAMRSQIDALTGHALVLPSQAFNQTEQDLTIAAPVRWVGTFNEPKPATSGAPVRSKSAEGMGGSASEKTPPGGGSAFWFVIGTLALIVGAVILARFLA